MSFLKKQSVLILIAIAIAFFISNQVLGPILENNNVVQDDFRQCCFWFWQWWDPELFKDDFFAPMYNSHIVRTPLLLALYRVAPFLTDNLIYFSKLLVYIICLATGAYGFLFFQALLDKYKSFSEKTFDFCVFGNKLRSIDIWALVFTTTLMVTVWCTDHVTAAHSRSFVWLGILIYMFYKVKGMNLKANVASFVMLFISPHAFLINFAMEFYSQAINYKTKLLDFKRHDFLAWLGSGLSTAFLYLVVFKDIKTQGVGTQFSVAEMKELAEFNPGGRHPIFGSSIADGSWWTNEHWGLGIGYLPISKVIIFAFWIALAYLAIIVFNKLRKKEIVFFNKLSVIFNSVPAQLLYAAISLYFASQILFPVLYLPSRYVAVPALLLSLIAINLGLGTLAASISNDFPEKFRAAFLVLVLLIGAQYFYASYKPFYHPRYVKIEDAVRQQLSSIPKDSLIAAHPILVDLNVASITTKRKVFVDYERSMAYTKESLDEIRRRNYVAIDMTYAETQEEFVKLAKANGITHFLAYYPFYSPSYLSQPRYMKPYNEYLRKIIAKKSGFFVKNFLDLNQQSYMLISIDSLK